MIRLAYIVAYAKLKFVSQLVWGIEIWPRHSFLTNAFVPLKSDLDLTAYVSNLDSLGAYLRFYKVFKKLLPFIGELNIYTPETINFIKNWDVNGFELERDPILARRFGIDLNNKKYFSREKAISYLLMALINDLHKLKAHPCARLKKWNYHFGHVNSTFLKHEISAKTVVLDETTVIFSIITAIVNLSSPASAKQAELLRTKVRFCLELVPQAENVPNFIDIVTPAIANENADVYGYFVEYLANTGSHLPDLSQLQYEVMSEQVKWVLFKFLKQSYSESAIAAAIRGLEDFRSLIEQYQQTTLLGNAADLLAYLDVGSEIIIKRRRLKL